MLNWSKEENTFAKDAEDAGRSRQSTTITMITSREILDFPNDWKNVFLLQDLSVFKVSGQDV